jgi:hypothetical protein
MDLERSGSDGDDTHRDPAVGKAKALFEKKEGT